MDKDLPYKTCAHKKDRSQTERPLPNLIIQDTIHNSVVPNLRPSVLQSRKKLPHPLQAAIKLSLRSRIRHANVFACAEALAGNRCYVDLTQ
jgi:hypothetical protein